MIQLFSGRGSGGLPPIHPYILPPFLGLYCHAAQWCTGVLVCAGELLYNAARLSAQRSVCICRGGRLYIYWNACLCKVWCLYMMRGGACVCRALCICMRVSKRWLTYRGVCLCMQAIACICRRALIYIYIYMQGMLVYARGACIRGRVLVCAGKACVCKGMLVPAWRGCVCRRLLVYAGVRLYM
jgi:hypothetical protein